MAEPVSKIRLYLLVGLACTLGLFGGLGTYTFTYAKGLSYFSNDPRACMNCHIMREHFDGWQKSPHHAVATCNDCHTPHTFFAKYADFNRHSPSLPDVRKFWLQVEFAH